jgi:phosphoribosylglycinamide formyltransferase-1
MTRIAVLASGSGSNFQALADGLRSDANAKLALVLCNVPGAKVLERARAAGVPAVSLDHKTFPSREAFDEKVVATLREHEIDLVCLAGYMRLVTPIFLRAFPGRVINIHPALLPSFPGMHGIRQALSAGVRVAGCTIHFVDEGTDTGPIIAQAAVPVLPGDDETTLGARIHAEEHRLYPLVVKAIAAGKVKLEGRAVKLTEALQ